MKYSYLLPTSHHATLHTQYEFVFDMPIVERIAWPVVLPEGMLHSVLQ